MLDEDNKTSFTKFSISYRLTSSRTPHKLSIAKRAVPRHISTAAFTVGRSWHVRAKESNSVCVRTVITIDTTGCFVGVDATSKESLWVEIEGERWG